MNMLNNTQNDAIAPLVEECVSAKFARRFYHVLLQVFHVLVFLRASKHTPNAQKTNQKRGVPSKDALFHKSNVKVPLDDRKVWLCLGFQHSSAARSVGPRGRNTTF